MTRNSLAILSLSLLLALPAMAQAPAAPAPPAEKPVPVVPTAEPKAAPVNTVKAAAQQPNRVLSEQEKQLADLLQKNRLVGVELIKLRADIIKANPDIKEKIEAGRTESTELRQKAAELYKQARELERQAAEANAKVAERVYGEVSPEFAAKSKEQGELISQIWKLKNEIAAEQAKNQVKPNALERPRPPMKPQGTPAAPAEEKPETAPGPKVEEAKPEAKPEVKAEEAKPEAKPAE